MRPIAFGAIDMPRYRSASLDAILTGDLNTPALAPSCPSCTPCLFDQIQHPQRPDTDRDGGKYDSLQGRQLCKKVLAKYVTPRLHTRRCMSCNGFDLLATTPSLSRSLKSDPCMHAIRVLRLPVMFAPERAHRCPSSTGLSRHPKTVYALEVLDLLKAEWECP